ncbi:hypothetical protein H5410_046868 [Solanum commersonii]|uniref:Uncharacterized protein n=1 Tax=Solanum commersonii TaxID=4109 RepID=A0A9J5XFK4_SOLCO|nr:hypothetical protein H5410_046868 [Solanum commersonii]
MVLMLISSPTPIVTWTCSLTCLSLKSKKISEKLVRIMAMPATLLECFCRSCLGKRLSLFNTLLKKTHLT